VTVVARILNDTISKYELPELGSGGGQPDLWVSSGELNLVRRVRQAHGSSERGHVTV